jgi:hypothetical protein
MVARLMRARCVPASADGVQGAYKSLLRKAAWSAGYERLVMC